MQTSFTPVDPNTVRSGHIQAWRQRARKAARSTEHEHELIRLEQLATDRRSQMRSLMQTAADERRTLSYDEGDQYELAREQARDAERSIDRILERIEPNPWKF